MAFDPNQPMLLPVDLREALPGDHPALLIGELVERLDLSEVLAALPEGDVGGRPGFDPRMMVRVWLYAYAAACARPASLRRRWWKACRSGCWRAISSPGTGR